MKQVCIDETQIRVSRIGFGTGSLHHVFSARARHALLGCAASSGITHFDTSPYYGNGLAEVDLGRFLLGQRADFSVATKVGLYPFGGAASHATTVWARKALGKVLAKVTLPSVDWSVKRAKASLHESLSRLRTDYVDFLFLHEPERALIEAEEFLRWLESEHAQGTIRSWGLAGVAERVAPWVEVGHSLALVVQTKDSLHERQADFIIDRGRSLQFTYGYLSSQFAGDPKINPEAIIAGALSRNSRGAIIVSSRRAAHISMLARLAE